MPKTEPDPDNTTGESIDWSLTHWEGAKREAMRRWAKLPLAHIIASLEEMEELANTLENAPEVRSKPVTNRHTTG